MLSGGFLSAVVFKPCAVHDWPYTRPACSFVNVLTALEDTDTSFVLVLHGLMRDGTEILFFS